MGYDLIILGGGTAGFSAALRASELDARTLLVNSSAIAIGGTCVNVGCVPTKHLLYVGEVIHRARASSLKGLRGSVDINFRKIMEEKERVVESLRKEKYERVLAELSSVELLIGEASFTSEDEIMVNGKSYTAGKFVLATGSSTFIPPIEGIAEVDYLTHVEALKLKDLPERMVVLGGGPLSIEFAQMFSRLGTDVTLLQRSAGILKREEPELSQLLMKYLSKEGVNLVTGAELKKIAQKGNEKVVEAIVNGKEVSYGAEHLLVATGRRANTSQLGIKTLGVKLGRRGEIVVDREMKAGRNLWAAGDVTGEPMLETVAAREGMVAANNALSGAKLAMDYSAVPHAVFTDPQLASVGLTDRRAKQLGFKCRCKTIPLKLVPKARAIKETRGAVKLVVDGRSEQVLGVHILAPNSAELIHEGAMIVGCRMTLDEVIGTLHVFPTLSEGIKLAAQSFRRDITKMSCCAE